MHKKKKEKKKIIIFSCLLVIIFISLVIMVEDERKLTNIEKVIKDSVVNISNFVSIPFFSIKKHFATDYDEYNKTLKKTEELGLNSELLKENNELKDLLNLNELLSDRTYINATVINRNVGYWFNELTINKGYSDGIEEGMAVITSKGLIGKIIKSSKYTSIVKLLTDEHMQDKISVKIEYEDRFVYGLLSSYKDNYFLIDGISNNIEIKEESKVTTSGLTDLFPSGILIGYVDYITTDNFDLAKTLKVKSMVDFNDLYYVTILSRNEIQNDV